jgi:hypothetical protein
MSGYMMVMAPCLVCRKVFASNPTYVPSLNNEPVCRDCMEEGNRQRIANGDQPHPIHPLAYEPQEA